MASEPAGMTPGHQTYPTISCAEAIATITGTAGDDTLVGTPDADVIVGPAGDDLIDGVNHSRRIIGSGHDDILLGTIDDDGFVALGGDDVARARTGEDTLAGGEGDDVPRGHGAPPPRMLTWPALRQSRSTADATRSSVAVSAIRTCRAPAEP